MESFFQKTDQLLFKSNYIALFYGAPGIGKTTLALSATKPLLIDIEGGFDRVDPDFWSDSILQTDIFDKINCALINPSIADYDTIIIDTVSALMGAIRQHIVKINSRLDIGGTLSQAGWGVLKNQFEDFVNTLKRVKKNIIFVAHEKESIDARNEKSIVPDLGGGASGNLIMNTCDVIGHLRKSNDGAVQIEFDNNGDCITKNSFGLPKTMKVPNPSEIGFNTFVIDVVERAYSDKKQKIEARRSAVKATMAKINSLISEVKTPQACSDLLLFFKSNSEYNSLEAFWKKTLWSKAKDLGFSYDKDTSEFRALDDNSESKRKSSPPDTSHLASISSKLPTP